MYLMWKVALSRQGQSEAGSCTCSTANSSFMQIACESGLRCFLPIFEVYAGCERAWNGKAPDLAPDWPNSSCTASGLHAP